MAVLVSMFQVDFANLEAQSALERRRAEADAERQRILLQRKVDFVKTQMNGTLGNTRMRVHVTLRVLMCFECSPCMKA